MTVSDIISKPESEPVEVGEMVFVVERYIMEKKGVVVKINPYARMPVMSPIVIAQIVALLFQAYAVAYAYFKNKEHET